MNLNIKSILACAALLAATQAMGVPARRDLRTVTQPDGSTLQVRLTGDEHRHYLLTADGKLLTENSATGAYEFARLNSLGLLESTGVTAADPLRRTAAQQAVAVGLDDALASAPQRAPRRRTLAQSGMGRFTCTFPRTGDVKVLVILVNYKDVKCTLSNPQDYFESMLNKPGFSEYGGTGSCRDYFLDNSGGKFRPQFDFFGPVELSQNRSYYGGNNAYGEDKAPEQMIVEACKQLDATVDFSEYDNDGDGVVDNVYVFYAGQGEASYGPKTSVWPHAWELTDAGVNLTLDGVKIDRYACSNEWELDRPDGIGTFIHEFSHVMGLPDLYCTDYSSAETYTPGEWSVMDYGPYNNDGRTPPAYSIYERNAMTWIDPMLIDGPASITLHDIINSYEGCIVTTSKETEFFLFENRQNISWDKYLPGHGMLIWHIDYNESVFDADVNNNASHQYVDIVEANNRPNNESLANMTGYSWPGTSGATSFTATTKPAFKEWSGRAIDLPITDITESNGVITFNVAGGIPVTPPIETPVAIAPTEIGQDYFVATWGEVEGATDYEVKLYAKGEGEPTTVTADMGTSSKPALPEGWTASSIDGYTSSGNYGMASPSFKFAKDEAWLQTCEFDSDVTGISFWCKGQQASGSSLEVLGLIDGAWVSLESFEPVKLEVIADAGVSDIPAGVRAVKFVWHKSAGNLSLDDIVITTGQADRLIRTYASSDGQTFVRCDGLEPGDYLYTVGATNGYYRTPHSAPMLVTLNSSNNSGVDTITHPDATPEYFDMLGRRIPRPLPGTICIERRGTVTTKLITR